MFATSASSSQTIKVSLGDDTRRLAVDLTASATEVEALVAIKKAIRQSFGLSDAEDLILKYFDDEGDLCTLAEHCLEDIASLSKGKPWKIQASLGAKVATVAAAPPPLAAPAASPATVAQSAGAADAHPAEKPAGGSSSCPQAGPEGSSLPAESDLADDDESTTPPEWEISAAMAFHLLPHASKATQLEVVRSALSAAGVERRKRVVKWCCEVLEHLDLVPEAMPLRPKLEAFVDGTDPEHFGDVLAELLKAWVSSSSPEMVEHTVAMHYKGLGAIMRQTFKALHGCKGEWKGKGKGKCGWWKGKGKGRGSSGDCEGDGGMSKGDFWRRKGDWWKAKAASKGKCAEEQAEHHRGRMPPMFGFSDPAAFGPMCGGMGSAGVWPACGPFAFKGALASMLAQKGLGKGCGFGGGWPQSGATQDTPDTTPASVVAAPEIPAPSAPPAPPEEKDLDSNVQLLLEMGLVSDPAVGLDLLRAHGGDLVQVVAVLTS